MPDVPPDSRIVYASCTETGYEVLRRLLDEGVPVSEILTIEPARAERQGVSGYRSFAEVADEHDIPVYYPETYGMDTDADTEHYRELDGDLLIVNGWQRLVPEDVLSSFTHGAVGNHGSAHGLPKGRGRSPLNWSLIEDLDRFLLSLIRLTPGADEGGVVATRKFDLTDYDTIETLYYKVAIAVQEMLLETLGPLGRGTADVTAQGGDPTSYPKRNPEDGEINWEDTTRDVYNLVRAVARPYPGAFTFDGDTRVNVWEAIPFSDDLVREAPPGRIVQTYEGDDFVVATPDGSILVTDWEADGWTPERGDDLATSPDHGRVDAAEHRHNLTSGGAES